MRNPKSALRSIAAFVDRWDWVLLALAAPFLLFPSPTRSLALIVVPGLWIAGRLAGQQPIRRTPLDLSVLLLAIMVLVSLYATYDINVSLPKITGIVLGIGTFYAFVRHGRQPRGWWSCLGLWLALGLGYAGLALVGAHWGTKISFIAPVITRLPSRLVDLGVEGGFSANEMAGALVWVAPVLIVLSALVIFRAKEIGISFGSWRKVALGMPLVGITAFMTGVLVLTQSRGGYLGFAFAILVLSMLILPRRARWLVVALAALAIFSGVFVLQSRGDVVTQILEGGGRAFNPASAIDTWEGRVEVWSRGLYGIQDFPFTGMGMNTFRHIVNVLYPFFLISPDVDIAHAHNEFLQAALDLGIPGLIGFVALYLGVFWMLWQVWGASHTHRSGDASLESPLLSRALALAIGAGLAGHIVYGLTDAVTLGAKPGLLFWMMLGLGVGLFEQSQAGERVQWRDLGLAVASAGQIIRMRRAQPGD